MDFEKARFNMVEQQIRPWDVLDPDVLQALSLVKRERFVSASYQNLAFADLELPIANGQSMWAPKIEARVLQALAVKHTDSILEIGTGSGYMAALLAARGEKVCSIEIDPQLVSIARENLVFNSVDNVVVEQGDGSAGWPAHGPYDVILFSASVPRIEQNWLDQLKPGGRLFAFVGQAPVMRGCLAWRAADGSMVSKTFFESCVPALSQKNPASAFSF